MLSNVLRPTEDAVKIVRQGSKLSIESQHLRIEEPHYSHIIPLNQHPRLVLEQLDQSFQSMSPMAHSRATEASQISLPSIQHKLNHQRNLLKRISSRVIGQLSLNYSTVALAQGKQAQMIKSTQRLTHCRPMKKRRHLNPSDYSFEEAMDSRARFFQPKHVPVRWDVQPESEWSPSCREGGAMCCVGTKVYLFGGFGSEVGRNLLSVVGFKWSTEQMCGDRMYPRHGHTMNYNKALFVLGGEVSEGIGVPRYVTSDVLRIDIENKTCRTVRVAGIIEGRRNHATVEVGKYLLISGGINKKHAVLNDMSLFNVITFRAESIQIDGDYPFQHGIAYHSACSVFWPDRYRVNLYQRDDDEQQNIRFEGIYFYGGVSSQQKVYDQLYILNVFGYPAKFHALKTKGKSPPPLTMHTMDYNEQQGYLVIYGGKVEGDVTKYNCEVFLYNLKSCSWLNVMQHGTKPESRVGHCSASQDAKIVVFGGLNLKGYVSPKLHLLELAFEMVPRQSSHQQSPKRRNSFTVDTPLPPLQNTRHELIMELNKSSILINTSAASGSPLQRRKTVRFGKTRQLSLKTMDHTH